MEILSRVHKLLSDTNEKFKLLLESGTDERTKEKSILESYLATESLMENMIQKMNLNSRSNKDDTFSNVKLNDLDELLDEIESETKQDTKSLDYDDVKNNSDANTTHPLYESLPQPTKTFINEAVSCCFFVFSFFCSLFNFILFVLLLLCMCHSLNNFKAKKRALIISSIQI